MRRDGSVVVYVLAMDRGRELSTLDNFIPFPNAPRPYQTTSTTTITQNIPVALHREWGSFEVRFESRDFPSNCIFLSLGLRLLSNILGSAPGFLYTIFFS